MESMHRAFGISNRLAGLAIFLWLLAPSLAPAQILKLKSGAFDPLSPAAKNAPALSSAIGVGPSSAPTGNEQRLLIVQWPGQIPEAGIELIKSLGGKMIQPIPEHAWLISLPQGVNIPAGSGITLQGNTPAPRWSSAVDPGWKVAPQVAKLMSGWAGNATMDAGQEKETLRPYSIQIARAGGEKAVISRISALVPTLVLASQAEEYETWRIEADGAALQQILRENSVFWIEPYVKPKLNGEREGLIAANLIENGATCLTSNGVSYAEWLVDIGLNGAGVTVQVIDDGFGNGTPGGSPDFTDRVIGIDNFTEEDDGNSIGGHGHLNASIVLGQPNSGGGDIRDKRGHGYLSGQGFAPSAFLYSTKIFNRFGEFETGNNSLEQLVRPAYREGARISTNSWGADVNGEYTTDAQDFDRIVRDADTTSGGLQAMIVFFSAGNAGYFDQTIGSPGTAKNVITVGALENCDLGPLDGSGMDQTFSNNINDIAPFSSRGPMADGRIAPTLTFIGVHVQGNASTDPGYDGSSVSGRVPESLELKEPLSNVRYYPPGQTWYTWSSGTSHSTPAVAGMAALLFQYLQPRLKHEPSPAIIKAALVAGATDFTNGSLNTPFGDTVPHIPNNHSGWGRAQLVGLVDNTRAQFFHDTGFRLSETTDTFPMPEMPPLNVTVDDPEEPLKIVLAWTDPPAGSLSGNTLVNDLNLTVTAPSGEIFFGNVFRNGFSVVGGEADVLNNLECVFIEKPEPGFYSVVINAQDLNGDALPGSGENLEQDFAIAIQNGGVISSTGRVRFDRSLYNCGNSPAITLRDADLAGFGEASVTISNPRNGDAEEVFLSEEGEGIFTGNATLEKAVESSEGDGILQVDDGDSIVVTYADESDELLAPFEATDTATLDCILPTLVSAELIQVTELDATFRVVSDEPVRVRIRYGTEADELSAVATSDEFTLEHLVTLSPLESCTVYFYVVEILDKAGNVAQAFSDDNPGVFLTNYFNIDYEDQFEPAPKPGWTHFATRGVDDWAVIEPVEPVIPHSPTHTWFVEDTETVKDASLVSPPFEVIDGSRLVFWHTYHFEPVGAGFGTTYDGGVIEISTDKGQSWSDLGSRILFGNYTHTVRREFQNPLGGRRAWGAGTLGEMKLVSVDLSDFAGQEAQVRWRIGTDISNLHEGTGWFIDDVVLGRVLDCIGELARLKLGTGDEFVACDLEGIPFRIEDIDLAGASVDDFGPFRLIAGDATTGGQTFTPEDLVEVEPGVWEGRISLVPSNTPGKFLLGGVLEVGDAQVFTLVYTDTTAHGTEQDIRQVATIDCVDPTIRHVSARSTFEGSTIEIEASEPVKLTLRYGLAPNAMDTTVQREEFLVNHTVILEKLISCTSYYFNFTVTDRAGHAITFNNFNLQYGFTTRTPLRQIDTIPEAPNGSPAPTFAWTHSTTAAGAKDWQIKADFNFAKSPPYVWVAQTTAIPSEVYLVSPAFDINDQANLFFWHTYFFESTSFSGLADGGVVEISLDGGNTWQDLDDNILENGYTGTINSGSNPMNGRRAWVGGGLGQMELVTVDLGPYQGEGRRIRFRMGNDASNTSFGTQWIIDNVEIANYLVCSNTFPNEPTITFPADGATSVSASGPSTLRWTPSASATSYRIYIGTRPDQLTFRGQTQTASFLLPTAPPLKAGTLYYWQVIAVNSTGATPSAMQTFRTLGVNPSRIAIDIAGNPVLSDTERKSVDYNDNGILAVDDLIKAINLKNSP